MTEKGQQGGTSPLKTDRGTTTISQAVVSSIAAAVVQEVAGVEPTVGRGGATLPGDNSPTVGEFFGGLTGTPGSRSRGVSVEVGEEEAAVDLTVTVPYGRSIPEITQKMRDTMIKRIENLAGLRVTEVNITVRDVFIPEQ